MTPGDLRRCVERWQLMNVIQDRTEQAWELCRRQARFNPRKDFEEKCNLRVVRNDKADEKLVQKWTDELQVMDWRAERQLEAQETKQMECEESSSQVRRAWGKFWLFSGYVRSGAK